MFSFLPHNAGPTSSFMSRLRANALPLAQRAMGGFAGMAAPRTYLPLNIQPRYGNMQPGVGGAVGNMDPNVALNPPPGAQPFNMSGMMGGGGNMSTMPMPRMAGGIPSGGYPDAGGSAVSSPLWQNYNRLANSRMLMG